MKKKKRSSAQKMFTKSQSRRLFLRLTKYADKLYALAALTSDYTVTGALETAANYVKNASKFFDIRKRKAWVPYG